MFIFQFMGGLGNQMFQYAAAKSLSLKRNIIFKADFDDPYQFVQRRFNLEVFNLAVEMANPKELKICKPKRRWEKRWAMLIGKDPFQNLYKEKKDFHYDPAFFECPDGAYIYGFWQSEKYFKEIEDIIRSDFQFATSVSGKNSVWLKKIKDCNAVSVHIRRGDYVTVPKTNAFHGVCDIAYYEKAIKNIAGKFNNPEFFFFSDDINWVKENIRTTYPSHYVDSNDEEHSYEDLRLMSCCRHAIIANSSFSWWAAWLIPGKDKNVIAPKKWMNDTSISTKDLIPESWIVL